MIDYHVLSPVQFFPTEEVTDAIAEGVAERVGDSRVRGGKRRKINPDGALVSKISAFVLPFINHLPAESRDKTMDPKTHQVFKAALVMFEAESQDSTVDLKGVCFCAGFVVVWRATSGRILC